MKKVILIITIMLLAMSIVMADTYTQEEFDEVYNALNKSNEMLKEADATIDSLKAQVDELTISNQSLIDQLKSTKEQLDSVSVLLDKAEKELNNSSKVISTLNGQRILVGGGAFIKTDFASVPNFGFKVNAGYKIWLGYIALEFSYLNDKSMGFGVSYNIVF